MFSGVLEEDCNKEIHFSLKTKEFGIELEATTLEKQFGWIKVYCNPKSGSIHVTPYIDGVAQGGWTFSGDGSAVERHRCKVDKLGYRLALGVDGTKDAEFYGFSIEYEGKEI